MSPGPSCFSALGPSSSSGKAVPHPVPTPNHARLLQHLAPQCTELSGTQWPAAAQHPPWFCSRMTPWINGFPQQLGRWISGKFHWCRTTVDSSVVQQAMATAPLTMSASQTRAPSLGSYLLLYAMPVFFSVLFTSYYPIPLYFNPLL